jgi:hypothetical protein
VSERCFAVAGRLSAPQVQTVRAGKSLSIVAEDEARPPAPQLRASARRRLLRSAKCSQNTSLLFACDASCQPA